MQKKRLACSKLRPLRPLFVRFNNRLALVLAEAINSKFVDSKAQFFSSNVYTLFSPQNLPHAFLGDTQGVFALI